MDRVLSQIRDWKRLTDEDINRHPEENRRFLFGCKSLDTMTILDYAGTAAVAINNLHNMQAKLIAKSVKGLDFEIPHEQDRLAETAIECLREFDVLGLTSDMPALYQRLCRKMGWCPPRHIERRNITIEQPSAVDTEIEEKIQELNQADMALFENAESLLANMTQSAFDTDSFEQTTASVRTKDIAPVFVGDGRFQFDFNMPIIANGHHGRDAPNTPEAAIWTGPGTTTTLFFPAMPLAEMTVQIGVKGYANPELRENIYIRADGETVEHRFVEEKGLADRIDFDLTTKREFIRLDIELSHTVESAEDIRKRGLSLSYYGYQL